jgi:hypothetical protein
MRRSKDAMDNKKDMDTKTWRKRMQCLPKKTHWK